MTHLKVLAVRAAIVGLVALGFGGVAAAISQSIPFALAAAAVGGALVLRRALRITADDIAF